MLDKVTYKTIFKGRLDFGSEKRYEKVLKMFQHRVESYYKQDILLVEEDIFHPEDHSLKVFRFITQGSTKSWKNTISVLEYVAQFAVAGEMTAWMTENGKILDHGLIEPQSDRFTVQQFLKGRKLTEEKGKEDEAVDALSKAIEKFDKHSHAYERRAFVKMQLKDYKSALKDYSKSIESNEYNAHAYMGRATVRQLLNQDKGILEDLENTIKNSIPLQPVFWQARRKKAEYHISKGKRLDALQDLKFFCSRKFDEDNPNYKWKRFMFHQYGLTLREAGENKAADAAFTSALEIESQGKISDEKILQSRGEMRKEFKMKGAKADLEKASKLSAALSN